MALEELEKISGNQEYQNIYEMRMKAEMDHASRLKGAENRGLKKGILALHSIGKSPEEISILMDISLEEVSR